jgi:hypothetical protein
MAVYSEPIEDLDYGGAYDVPIDVWIYRGDCNRTATSVSFSFGVRFKPETNTTQSIAAWYGDTKKYAYHNKAGTNYNGTTDSNKAKKGTYYYAHYNHNDSGNYKIRTSESLCFSYTNNSINANTTSVSVTVGLGWNAHNPTQVGTQTFSIAIPKYIGPPIVGKTEIIDNYNNTFYIKATAGGNGTNNEVKYLKELKWSYDSAAYNVSYGDDADKSAGGSITAKKTLEIKGPGTTRKVYAKSRTVANNGAYIDSFAKGSTGVGVDIRQYVGPNKIDSCSIYSSKGKLTLKEDWTLHWTEPGTNNGCPVKGYQVALFKQSSGDNKWSVLPLINDKGDILIGSTGKYQTESTSLSLKLGAKYYTKEYNALGTDLLKPGDKIRFSVKAYTKFGKNNEIDSFVFNNNANIETYSTEYPIYNSGIMRVKANNAWTEGQVWVKVDGDWKEADVVKVKVNGVWEDSE